MNPKRNTPFFAFCVLLNAAFHAVAFSLHASALGIGQKDFYFRHLKTEQGLSNGIVNEMLKDRSGFLWIATLNGLNCFDGSHFQVWKADPRDSTKLSSDALYGICEDTSGNIWCVHNSGVSRYDRKKNIFKNYKLFNSVTGQRSVGNSNAIVCTRNGELVTYSSTGIYVYDPAGDRFLFYPELQKEGKMDCEKVYNKSFVQHPYRNGVLIGTDNGIKYFDLSSQTFSGYRNNPEKSTLFNDHPCNAFGFDAKKDLLYFDGSTREIMSYSFTTNNVVTRVSRIQPAENHQVNCLFSDNNSNIWISVYSSTSLYYENSSGRLYTLRHEPELNYTLASDYFLSAMQDSHGNLYIGSLSGISYLNTDRDFISIIRFPDTLAHNRRYYLHQLLNCDRQNNLWFAPSYQYLLKYNSAGQNFQKHDILTKTPPGAAEDIRISTMEADSGTLYFGTLDGIHTYDVSSGQFEKLRAFPESEKVDGKYILCMLLTSGKELWFTSHHNGVFRYEIQTGAYSHYRLDTADTNSFSGEYIFDMLEDKTGNVWFCAENDGLIRFNREKDHFEFFQQESDTATPEVFYSFECDRENNLWVQGILSGLNKFDTRKKSFAKEVHIRGFSNFQYNYLLMDNDNRLWLSYYSQYSVLDIQTGHIKNFEIDFARVNNDYANYSCRMADGRIAAESKNSFFIFNPRLYEVSGPVQTITISDFYAGESLSPFVVRDSIFILNSSQNFFSVNFSTLSLLGNKDIQFAYKLEGLHDDWEYCGNRQTASFTNLGGGDYLFRVKAMGADGKWQESGHPLRISIRKVFYSTIWFRVFLIALLGGCIAWYIRILKNRRLKKESDKAIAYFANSLQGKNKIEELLWDITHNVITRTNLVDCVVYLLDHEQNVLVQKAAFGEKNPEEYKILNPIEIPLGKGIVGSVAMTGVAEIIPDTSKDSRYIADDSARLSELAVPILAEGRVIGVIDSEHPDKNFFTREHLQLLKTIASITATKIVKVQKEMEVEANEERLEDLKTQVTYTRQQALQAQMNPHFIFNCLNSINGFILQNDAATASTFLIKFSRLIRLILEHSNEKTISLQSELDALKLYVEMEALRFGKKFTYRIHVDEEVMPETIQVPPLILQPFVENSIWHGLLHKQTEGELRVHIAQKNGTLECVIEDNGIGREQSAALKSRTSSGKKSLGLQLTRERLALMHVNGRRQPVVQVLDMKDENGKACGTKVSLTIPVYSEFN